MCQVHERNVRLWGKKLRPQTTCHLVIQNSNDYSETKKKKRLIISLPTPPLVLRNKIDKCPARGTKTTPTPLYPSQRLHRAP